MEPSERIDADLPAHTPETTLASFAHEPSTHPPRILILYGSLRENSFSRYLSEECGRVLTAFGAEVRTFDSRGLPVFDRASFELPKVRELRGLTQWSEAHVWVSPEQHGSMTAAFKHQVGNVEILSRRYSEQKERRVHGALKPALGVAPNE